MSNSPVLPGQHSPVNPLHCGCAAHSASDVGEADGNEVGAAEGLSVDGLLEVFFPSGLSAEVLIGTPIVIEASELPSDAEGVDAVDVGWVTSDAPPSESAGENGGMCIDCGM